MGLILVDSSVWIDILHARSTSRTTAFRQLSIAGFKLAAGDLMMAEVLQERATKPRQKISAATRK